MSFIRAKKFSNGRVYYYEVESYRDHGKVKQKVIWARRTRERR